MLGLLQKLLDSARISLLVIMTRDVERTLYLKPFGAASGCFGTVIAVVFSFSVYDDFHL